MNEAPTTFTDQHLLDEVVRSGEELLRTGEQRLAALGDVPTDPRWDAPWPMRFEAQVAVLFLGSLDACYVTITLLQQRASQQAFHTLRFQIESIALIRWMAAPNNVPDCQHRAYRVACGQVSRSGQFLMRDAKRDRNREALDQVRTLRDWGAQLREIAAEDGVRTLKQVPKAAKLFKSLDDVADYANFKMYSEFGSHPGTAGNTLFALTSGSGKITYDLQGSLVERGFFATSSIFYLWKTYETVSAVMGWDGWLQSEARPIYQSIHPVLNESLRRRKASRASGS